MGVRTQRGSVANTDLARLAKIGENLRKLIAEMSEIFPERENLLQQIMYALLTREHPLIFGMYGTGKSDMLFTLFDAIEGANRFSIALTKFMTEASIFGVADVKQLREKGQVRFQRQEGILDAEFAELDEFLDANTPLQRSLLGVLNERQFKRGRQFEEAKLHTAIASTNCNPESEIKRDPALGAVIDRFLFQCRVKYLSEAPARRMMYQKYLAGARPVTKISYEDLKYSSDVVISANQITDPKFVEVYDNLMEAFLKQAGKEISDRRKCKLLKLVEANAVLNGRFAVDYEDLMAVRWGAVYGDDQEKLELFKKVAEPIIAKAKEAQAQSLDEVQIKLLNELDEKIPQLAKSKLDDQQLLGLNRTLIALRKQVQEVRAQLDSTRDLQVKITQKIDKVAKAVKAQLDGE